MFSLFRNMGFRWKLTLPLLLVATLFIGLAVTAFWAVNSLDFRLSRMTDELLPQSATLLEADRDMYQALTAERELLVESGARDRAQLLTEHSENLQQAIDRVTVYADSTQSAKGQQLGSDFQAAFDTWKQTTDQIVRLAGSNNGDEARTLSYGRGYQQFIQARDLIDQMTQLVDEEAASETALAEVVANKSDAIVLTVVAVGLLLCALIIAFFPGLITRPLQDILRRIRDMADGEGDLTKRIHVTSSDELGQVGMALNQFLEQLQTLIQQVTDSTLQVASASEQMSTIAANQDRLVNEQYLTIDQVSTAAIEMSAAIHEVADNATSTAEAASAADRQGHAAAEVVGQTMDALRRLAADVEEAAGVINNLESDSDNIGGVLSVIQAIAEQTNLLALNAAIEAARAGEQGRGFAVVADEVRALAARTQDSTRDIQQMIQSLQSGSAQAVSVMQRGAALAAQSVEQASGAEHSLNETAQSVVRINDMAAQIAAACEEQSKTTEEISRNISGVRDLSNQAAQSSEESRQASDSMARLASALQDQVGRFKT
ncbi:methyl-accepting chemotaxis protein [Halopseudomonas salegens]|uniref:Methyl-accepting chemotaxis protein n=1 Tax=Halopseudomonas salegens TaxID=1434072 RepID=A0A1H2HYT9_9GAMM|nr:methyl-accepting chemotaxis protein [Halopseudomonas salegens]SDU36718.1 methyl-accepting chemotaxis protein [Halopseudomonas salegens]